MADEFDNMTEEQLSAARGDNAEPAAEPVVEPETPPELPPVDEPEPEVKTEPEPEPEPEPEASPKNYMIPKSRYDAVMGRLRAAEAKLQEHPQVPVEAAAPSATPQPSVDDQLAEIDTKYTQAIADGQYEQAAQLMGQARTIERQMFSQALSQVAANTKSQASVETREQLRYDTLLSEVERYIPQVAPDSETYDDGLVAEIGRLASALEKVGERPTDALEQALSYVFPAGWREPATKAKAAPAARTTNVAKNAASAKSMPPKLSAGENSDKAGMAGKIDIMKLSDAELEKLTDTQLAALRGDVF